MSTFQLDLSRHLSVPSSALGLSVAALGLLGSQALAAPAYGPAAPILEDRSGEGEGGEHGPEVKEGVIKVVQTFFEDVHVIDGTFRTYGSALSERLQAVCNVFAGFAPEQVIATNELIHELAFWSPFVYGESGYATLTGPGELQGEAIEWILSPDFQAAHAQGVKFWEIDPYAAGIQLPDTVDYLNMIPDEVEVSPRAFVYTGSFGSGPEHFGYATQLQYADQSIVSFVPMVLVPEGPIDAEMLGGFVAGHVAGGPNFDYVSLLAGDLPDPTANSYSLGYDLIELAFQLQAAGFPCDPFALVDCLQNVLGNYLAAVKAENDDFRNDVNEILANTADDALDDLWAYIGGGTAAGALTGAAAGSPAAGIGALPGAALGGLIGAIGGAFGWLIATGNDAEDSAAKIEEREQEHQENLCNAMRAAAQAAKDCWSTWCPDLLPHASAEIDAAVAASGC